MTVGANHSYIFTSFHHDDRHLHDHTERLMAFHSIQEECYIKHKLHFALYQFGALSRDRTDNTLYAAPGAQPGDFTNLSMRAVELLGNDPRGSEDTSFTGSPTSLVVYNSIGASGGPRTHKIFPVLNRATLPICQQRQICWRKAEVSSPTPLA